MFIFVAQIITYNNNTMKVISNKPKGQRMMKAGNILCLKYDGTEARTKRPIHIEPVYEIGKDTLWFSVKQNDWTTELDGTCSSCYYAMCCYGLHDVYSLKAAIRLIKKWNIPVGTKFKVDLPYVGYDFIVTK